LGSRKTPVNEPNGGPQRPITLPSDKPIYSTYTGNLVGYGTISKGTMSDAPEGHPNHGKPFHVVEVTRGGDAMTHYMPKK
jgi:hypothetical protein